MNYLLWIRQNQFELVIAAYLILLYVSHHTFTPNLFWFRNLTTNPIFRLGFLALVIYYLYNLYTGNIKNNMRQARLASLLVIAYLLTEYHGRTGLEFFENVDENGNFPFVFIKKSGQNLFLTYTEVPSKNISLSNPIGNFNGQMWQIQTDGGQIMLSPYNMNKKSDFTLNSSLQLRNGDSTQTGSGSTQTDSGSTQTDSGSTQTDAGSNLWTIEMLDQTAVDQDTQAKDDGDVSSLTGGENAPCQDKEVHYVKLKYTGSGNQQNTYLSANKDQGFQPTLSTEDTDNIWLVYKCQPAKDKSLDVAVASTNTIPTTSIATLSTDTPSAPLDTPVTNTIPTTSIDTPSQDVTSDKKCLGIETFTNTKLNQNQFIFEHTLRNNDLNAYLNNFKTDTPIGKAYKKCADGICYNDNM